jgi:hypothetical protein
MTSYFEAAQLKNKEHTDKPQVGDFWHEMFAPYHVVLAVTDTHVIICEKTKETDSNHYTFDLSETKTVTLQEHKDLVTYKSESMKHKFVADVVPESKMMPAIKEWRESRREAMLQEMKYFL